MRILISNDDGIEAPGLLILAKALSEIGSVTVVAPDRDRSGASNSLTLDMPIRVKLVEPNRYKVSGTPTDCVHLALAGLLDFTPDIVVSGINNAPNMGDDVLYSGTVAAAMEGRTLGYPAIAVSLVTTDHIGLHFETAAAAVRLLIEKLKQDPLPADTILNVNVPDVPFAELCGFEATRLGHRHRSQPSIGQTDPRGRPIWWIGPAGVEKDDGPGTDFHAVRRRCVSITPITVDLTRYTALDQIAAWVSPLTTPRLC